MRKDFGLPYHTQNAFYYDLVKSALLANFNPNTRGSRFNPNTPAYTPVDKSDLVILDPDDQRTPRKGYTTEFCFDANGVFEITTLGDIAQNVLGIEKPQSIYQRKMRTVVQVYDVLRHTNQYHFAKTFNSQSLSSRGNRRNIVLWPEPLEAITEFISLGAKEDGRIELSGLKDGLRMEMPTNSREQTYQSPETIVMAHGFQDRTEASRSQIRRLSKQPGGAGTATKAFTDRLSDVYDANYSRISPIMRKMYRKEELVSLGFNQGSVAALNQDPVADRLEFGTDLRPDGLHTSLFTTGHMGGRFLLLPAHNRIGAGFGQRQNLTGNVPYYNGGLAFWVKFEFDGIDPVFSGLIGCTQVISPVGNGPRSSEGTQFYIFKNTKGQLRIVRMYYHQAFLSSGGGDAGGGGGGGEGEGELAGLLPKNPNDDGDAPAGAEDDFIDLDPQKPIARSDIIIDISYMKAHEWHHIAVDWNDESPSQTLQVWLDFEKVQGGGPYIPQEEISGEPTSWVRLNVREPRDGLFVGGFIRPQKVAEAGVFKWWTNSLGGGDSKSKFLQPVEPTVKRVLANATIDELVTYTGTFSGVRNYFSPRGSPGYFSNQAGEYANLFEIPMPPGVDHVVLRSFDWTTYHPTFYTGSNRAPQKLQTSPIECQVILQGSRSPSKFRDPWRDPSIRNRVSGYPASRRRGSRPGSNAELIYRFTIPPAIAATGSLAGGSMQTPVIDDVTLTYYLSDPKILHQEEDE